MRTKKIVCFFVVSLLLSGLMVRVDASSTSTISLHGVRLTVDLTFPDEANPSESIWHNATITANTNLFLRNLTMVIKAPVNSSWQEAWSGKDERNILMQEDDSFLWLMGPISLPEGTNGKLLCFMYLNTSQSTDYAAFSFYTTLVSEPTFSEMQTLYYEMLANYTSLQQDYETLLSDYNGLLADYSIVFDNYTTLLSEYDQLVTDHGTLQDDYEDLWGNYSSLYATYTAVLSERNQLDADLNIKVSDYDTLYENYRAKTNELGNLQEIYSALNDTYYDLQTERDNLRTDITALNQTYINLQTDLAELQERFTDSEGELNSDRIVMFIFVITVAALITFIVYLKRKKEQPYVVIRKETVSMKSEEET